MNAKVIDRYMRVIVESEKTEGAFYEVQGGKLYWRCTCPALSSTKKNANIFTQQSKPCLTR